MFTEREEQAIEHVYTNSACIKRNGKRFVHHLLGWFTDEPVDHDEEVYDVLDNWTKQTINRPEMTQ